VLFVPLGVSSFFDGICGYSFHANLALYAQSHD
jgi:hypothetical protein